MTIIITFLSYFSPTGRLCGRLIMDGDCWLWKSTIMKTRASLDVERHVVKFKHEAAEWRDELGRGGWDEKSEFSCATLRNHLGSE